MKHAGLDRARRLRRHEHRPNLHEARHVLAERIWENRNAKFRLDRQPITMKKFAAKWDENYMPVKVRLRRMKGSSAELPQPATIARGSVLGQMRRDAITLPHIREFVKAPLAKDSRPSKARHRYAGWDAGKRPSKRPFGRACLGEPDGRGPPGYGLVGGEQPQNIEPASPRHERIYTARNRSGQRRHSHDKYSA